MNKNMTKFLILAIILCITVGVASATEASSDDATAKDAPTITKNTPTTEKIITKTENKKINKNNKTTNVKKDTGNLYVSPDVTEAKTGTNEDPTTIIDAVSKVTQNGNIILLPGTTGVYTPTEQIVISDDTTQEETHAFNITSTSTDIKIDASQVANLFKINSNYTVTFNNVSIHNAVDIAIYNAGNLTINGEATYQNNTAINTAAGGAVVYNRYGNLIINGSNTFTKNNNRAIYTIGGTAGGNLTVTGENIFSENKDSAISFNNGYNTSLIVNGSNKFINNYATGNRQGAAIYSYADPSAFTNAYITGKNLFKNNTIEAGRGGAICFVGVLNVVGENIFEDNYINGRNDQIGGAAIGSDNQYATKNKVLNITGNNTFKNNTLTTTYTAPRNTFGGAINVDVTEKVLINGTNTFKDNTAAEYGGAIRIRLAKNANATITGENLFENNKVTSNNVASAGALYIQQAGPTNFKMTGSIFKNNNGDNGTVMIKHTGTGNKMELTENTFTNNTGTNAILLVVSKNDDTAYLTITNNEFKDNIDGTETVLVTEPCPKTIENNTYTNTYIGIEEINLQTTQTQEKYEANTDIPLDYEATLKNPLGYDTNILEKLNAEVYVNDENKYNITGNTFTINEEYTPETQGILNIHVKIGTTTSNILTLKLKPTSKTNISTENPELGQTTQLQATFYDDEGTPVTGGKAIFKVNGKTLRNDDGNVIYVDVTNGIAELPDVKITSEWMKPDTTIQAVYIGSEDNTPIITQKTSIQVTKPEANIQLTIPEEASAGETITLQAKVTSGEALVTTGRVVFKLNGKTLKDVDGNALYVNVENGFATTTYTIPSKTKAKTYVLSAVFTDSIYERSEKNETIVIK